jgi:hypothetical protein
VIRVWNIIDIYPIKGRKPPEEGVSGGFRFLYEKVFL